MGLPSDYLRDHIDDLLAQDLYNSGMRLCSNCEDYHHKSNIVSGLCPNCRCEHCDAPLKPLTGKLEQCKNSELCGAIYEWNPKTRKITFVSFPIDDVRPLLKILNSQSTK